ncbi:hypothetical protein JCM17843_25460 [Kordiimonadales bacterium JCM 17843]|nr:hypothetical protein JCM17843_25460 [Kordiimonadales bacterium JCM 17843]
MGRAVVIGWLFGAAFAFGGFNLIHDLLHQDFRAAADFLDSLGKIDHIIAKPTKYEHMAGRIIKPVNAIFLQARKVDGFRVTDEIKQDPLTFGVFDPLVELFIGMFP